MSSLGGRVVGLVSKINAKCTLVVGLISSGASRGRLRVRLSVRPEGDGLITDEVSDVTGLTDRWEQR
jgi:hypothetical protein